MENNKEMTQAQKLEEELLFKRKNAADLSPSIQKEAFDFCEDYKKFLDAAKTEREATAEIVRLAKKQGYKPFDESKAYSAGDKIYFVNRDKSVICSTIGEKPLDAGTRLMIAHIDSPRLDLKPNPLYEDGEISLFKTHYYGGIRKYQWGVMPLALHGVVMKANGEKVEICIGEDDSDPVFCVSDLLPHLSKEQNKRPLSEGLKGEELNIIIGSLPFEDEDAKQRVKLKTMQLINEKYGITERDFTRAEIEAVPAQKARDIGFDRSLIGAYGHDDRVCAYPALMAEFSLNKPTFTSVTVLTDKEETGSDGVTGLQGDYVFHYLQRLAKLQNANYLDMLVNSKCVSADVDAAFDPTFPDVYDPLNCSRLNSGVIVTKYTGSGGKNSTNDATAEMMGYVTGILDKNDILWQTGELGKVDAGGGGTIAKYVANRNVDTVDVGVPVISMHAPFEIVSKLDVYMTYKAFSAFASTDK